jgi:heme oxygenase (mycobilin-producing)
MSIVRINVVTVDLDQRSDFENNFLSRARDAILGKTDGLEDFLLLRPSDGEERYMVYSKWESEDALKKWFGSDSFQAAHQIRGTKAHERTRFGKNVESLAFDVCGSVDG